MASLLGLPAEDWSALAAWAAVVLACAAGVIAFRQLSEARAVRREQAQPYVVAFLDQSAAGEFVVDLVVKNFGTTAATDVRISPEPALSRAASGDNSVALPESIPVLVPGQSWRTFWDTTLARYESELPRRHDVTIRFSDSRGKASFSLRFVLDWEPIFARNVVTVRTVHHAAEALRNIEKTLKSWRESAAGGLKVYSRDGDARDERQRAMIEERRRESES